MKVNRYQNMPTRILEICFECSKANIYKQFLEQPLPRLIELLFQNTKKSQ